MAWTRATCATCCPGSRSTAIAWMMAAGVWAWKGNVQTGKTTEAFRDLYPLPASELLANPNLKQNAGY